MKREAPGVVTGAGIKLKVIFSTKIAKTIEKKIRANAIIFDMHIFNMEGMHAAVNFF